jgi:hypothetical protein
MLNTGNYDYFVLRLEIVQNAPSASSAPERALRTL